jgi:hypothetical protein
MASNMHCIYFTVPDEHQENDEQNQNFQGNTQLHTVVDKVMSLSTNCDQRYQQDAQRNRVEFMTCAMVTAHTREGHICNQ